MAEDFGLVLRTTIREGSSVVQSHIFENDVPGAKFRSSDIAEHSNVELKRWLQCRGLNLSGKRQELIDRCKACIEAGGEKDIIISIDEGKWFQKKVQQVLVDVQDKDKTAVPVLPVSGWKVFPAISLPNGFCYGSIYDHIIASAKISAIDGDSNSNLTDFNTSKPMLKGRQYFRSGHVKDIKHQEKDEHHFLKCIVQASYSIQVNYHVSVTLQANSGKVMDASCEFKASAMGRCNHIAALLFAIDDYILENGNHVASTDKLCSWNKGRKNKRDPQPCHTAVYSKKMKLDRIINFDPLTEKEDEDMFINRFITTLPTCQSTTMFQQVLELNYTDYEVDKKDLGARSEAALKLFKSTVTGEGPYEIPNTSKQSGSIDWHNNRKLRITASIAKDVTTVKSTRAKYHLLERLLWKNKQPEIKSLRYGRENEAMAFKQYADSLNKSESVQTTGLWVNPKYPELGCSPDGIICSDGKITGLLEIKCPLVLENIHPVDIHKLTPKQRYRLCYTISESKLCLKKTHEYFYQVQMQMAICETEVCDFVIWSPKGMILERIKRDVQFWDELLPNLIRFHHNVLMPEYLEMRVPRRRLPVEL